MLTSAILFYCFAALILAMAMTVILVPNPVYSALSLVLSMVGVAGLFFCLEAYFLAGVQMVVYAGAVMVLFVMVIMLFDLKTETKVFSFGTFGFYVRVVVGGLLLGLISGAIYLKKSKYLMEAADASTLAQQALGKEMFWKYLFAFESVGVLLFVIIVGAIALAKARGGTHA